MHKSQIQNTAPSRFIKPKNVEHKQNNSAPSASVQTNSTVVHAQSQISKPKPKTITRLFMLAIKLFTKHSELAIFVM